MTYLIMGQDLASTRQTRRHSPSTFVRTRQTRRHSPSHVARTRQTRQHSPKAIFEKNVTRLDKFAQVMSESREFGASGHCLVLLHFYDQIFKSLLRGYIRCPPPPPLLSPLLCIYDLSFK